MDSWEFVEDDDGFFAWLEANPEGYFVNVVPGLYDHGILHPARCGHVHRSAGPWTNARKVCAETHLAVMRAGPDAAARDAAAVPGLHLTPVQPRERGGP